MKNIAKLGLLMLLSPLCIACGGNSSESTSEVKDDGYHYGENEMYQKLWETKCVYNESIVLLENEDGTFSSNLIYKPTKIISVRNFDLTKEYKENEYKIEGNKFIATAESTMPRLTKKNISCEDIPELIGGSYQDGKGGNILFTEGPGIFMHQVNVTYEHNDTWQGAIPKKLGAHFPKLRKKLQNKEPINLVVNGDSIFTGANASSKFGMEPYQDTFPEAFAKELKRNYGSEVTLTNTAVGGKLSDFGKANVEANVIQYNPDLVIIGYGMNDGSWDIKPSDFVDNIEFMVEAIQANCPNAEIIVCATIIANPDSAQFKGQANYLKPLQDMAATYNGVAVLDMTTYSLDLLKIKNSFELYANNINHPCDFMVRQYVANLLNIIEK